MGSRVLTNIDPDDTLRKPTENLSRDQPVVNDNVRSFQYLSGFHGEQGFITRPSPD